MKTIASCVQEIIVASPFLEEGLSRQIINFSALAKDLNEPISKMLRKPVKEGAIMMALRRYQQPLKLENSKSLKKAFEELGDITVRSNLSDFTFQNSKTLIDSHAQILDKISSNHQIFYAFTRGMFESNIIISTSEKDSVLKAFKNETQIGLQEKLSAISIYLPKGNTKKKKKKKTHTHTHTRTHKWLARFHSILIYTLDDPCCFTRPSQAHVAHAGCVVGVGIVHTTAGRRARGGGDYPIFRREQCRLHDCRPFASAARL